MSKHKSEDYKISAVKYFLIGEETQESVCKIFKCSVRSLLRWTKRYIEKNEIKRHNRKPIAYKIKKNHVNFILNQIKKYKTITMNELLIKLNNEFPLLSISRVHLGRTIKNNFISLKLMRRRHEPIIRFGKDININEKLKEFYDQIKKYKLEDIINCINMTFSFNMC
jgi:transposase